MRRLVLLLSGLLATLTSCGEQRSERHGGGAIPDLTAGSGQLAEAGAAGANEGAGSGAGSGAKH